jgi:cysteine desulfurase
MRRYYLDHNATTPLDERVRAVMEPYSQGLVGNASSVHAEGRRARAAIDNARDKIAATLGAKSSEIIFTSGGTESCNLVVRGLALAHMARGKHVIVSAGEHHAVLHAARILEKWHGFSLSLLPLQKDGRIDPDDLKRALRPDTVLVSVLSANNETGVKSPVGELAALCSERGILFHTDAIQSAGKETIRLDLPRWRNVDALGLTAHKFGGPMGAGFLWLRAATPIERLMEGGAHENERRPGTENVAAIVGLAEAFALADRDAEARNARALALTERLWLQLEPLGRIRRNGHATERIGNTLNFSVTDLHAEEFLIGLDLSGLAVSSGSACMVGSVQHSHVLRAMGIGDEEAGATVRLSIGHDLEESDIDAIAQTIGAVIRQQRR